jgi:hypothetical protein
VELLDWHLPGLREGQMSQENIGPWKQNIKTN